MSRAPRVANAYVRSEHADVLAAVDACADEVCAAWEGDTTKDSRAIVDPLRTRLDDRGVLERLPVVLSEAVRATGHDLPATPVALPPYVVVTSRGPVLRATIEPGRLVIRLDVFEVDRTSEGPRYRRLDGIDPLVSLERRS